MSIDNSLRAEVLVQALPYIRKYYGKTVVVKYGGSAMTDAALKSAVMGDIVLLSLIGVKVVLVHGGGPEINDMLSRVGKRSEFVDGLRVTDAETVDIVQMVLAGKVNKSLVTMLGNIGGKAIGLSGMDGQMIVARQKDEKLGFVGDISDINTAPITDIQERGYIPVISTLGCDGNGCTFNINADTAASRIAGALGAEALVSLTDVRGILRDHNDPTSLIAALSLADADGLIASGAASGGMIPKIECCTEAIRLGVQRVFVIDGRVPHSILIELLTDEGIGTMFTK